jgi:hypothetical protein
MTQELSKQALRAGGHRELDTGCQIGTPRVVGDSPSSCRDLNIS